MYKLYIVYECITSWYVYRRHTCVCPPRDPRKSVSTKDRMYSLKNPRTPPESSQPRKKRPKSLQKRVYLHQNAIQLRKRAIPADAKNCCLPAKWIGACRPATLFKGLWIGVLGLWLGEKRKETMPYRPPSSTSFSSSKSDQSFACAKYM